MPNRIPDLEELRAFLRKQIAEAHRMDEPARADDLLDKLRNAEELQMFLACVLPGGQP